MATVKTKTTYFLFLTNQKHQSSLHHHTATESLSHRKRREIAFKRSDKLAYPPPLSSQKQEVNGEVDVAARAMEAVVVVRFWHVSCHQSHFA